MRSYKSKYIHVYELLTSHSQFLIGTCFIYEDRLVALSLTLDQARIHNLDGFTNGIIHELVVKLKSFWTTLCQEAGRVRFNSCTIDVQVDLSTYNEVNDVAMSLRLAPQDSGGGYFHAYGPHLGSSSHLFHWIDDDHILAPRKLARLSTVVRLACFSIRRSPEKHAEA